MVYRFPFQLKTVNVKNRIRKKIFGLSIPQEYLCLANEKLDQSLSAVLTFNSRSASINITDTHIFLGYKPLVFAIPFRSDMNDAVALNEAREIEIEFRGTGLDKSNVVARLTLEKMTERSYNGTIVLFFQGVRGEHHFLAKVHQLANQVRNGFSRQREGNVGLHGNLYDQVRIAYSIPRKISVITLSDGEGMNMFPTDLHGIASGKIYLSSLRIGGKANEQVEQIGVLALSDVDSSDYRNVYDLGKNHMQNLRDVASFRCHSRRSAEFNLPLPASVLSYLELRRLDSFDVGIHRIHSYEIVRTEKIHDGGALTHIHQYYAQWRIDRHHNTQFLLR